MQFTKAMIDLAKEIRRHAPSELKPSIKMANPELFSELTKFYHQTKDAVLRALIKEICELAGDPWPQRLQDNNSDQAMTVKVYRGQARFVPKETSEKAPPKKKESVRIYRGQIVHQ